MTSDAMEADRPRAPSQAALVLFDLRRGALAYHLWYVLGWQDIRQRYRRSVLGPFWLTLGTGVLVAVMGVLYGLLFKVNAGVYVPHIALGFIVWTLISETISDGCYVFIKASGAIKDTGLPLSIHVYRLLWRDLLIFFHNVAVYVVVAVIFGIWPGWVGLLVLPGLALLYLNALWAVILFGMISARFRDVPPIVTNIMRICFFVTPIIWMPEFLPQRSVLLEVNLFYHMVEVVRAPLLGKVPELSSWVVVLSALIGGWILTFVVFRYCRRQIAYWV